MDCITRDFHCITSAKKTDQIMNKIILFLVTIFIFNYANAQELKETYYNYVTGNVKESGHIDKNGYPIGEWKYYLENGSLDYKINWETNYIKKYYATGELKEKGTFIPETGTHIGEWITYYKNGKIKTQRIYDENGIEKHNEVCQSDRKNE